MKRKSRKLVTFIILFRKVSKPFDRPGAVSAVLQTGLLVI